MLQGFWGGVIVCLVDQTIVFLVLGGLAVTIELTRRLLERIERPQPAPAAPARTDPPPVDRGAGPPRGHLAAIAAAVHAHLGGSAGSFRIVGSAPAAGDAVWRQAGRLELMGGDEDGNVAR